MKQKPKEFALEYAGFWIRFGAAVTDLLILGLVVGIIYCISSAPIIWLTSGAVLSFIYWLSFWMWRGQTPGKMAVGIKVIRTDSSPITWRYALLRCAGYIASVATLFIGFIWVAFDSCKQGLHDKIADTYVVKLPVKQVLFSGSYARSGVSCV